SCGRTTPYRISEAEARRWRQSVSRLWLRPPRQQRPLPRMRHGDSASRRGGGVKRRLLIFVAIILLALSAAMLILWPVTYWRRFVSEWQSDAPHIDPADASPTRARASVDRPLVDRRAVGSEHHRSF